jgi:hypothetical protein
LIAKKRVLGPAAFALMWPALAAAQEGRPVTAADLSGKKVCWNGGRLVTTYHADGQVSDNQGQHTVWSVPEPGVVKFRIRYVPMFVLPDGRIHVHQWRGKSGGSLTNASLYHDTWGTICN